MKINKLIIKPVLNQDKKTALKFEIFQQLINELNKKDIPIEMAGSINQDIEEINKFAGSDKETLGLLKKKQESILKKLDKELRLVTVNYNRNLWLVLGMSAFGLLIGVALGLSLGNIGLLGIGLPIGMGIGVALGTHLYKKAKAEGKQLEVELK